MADLQNESNCTFTLNFKTVYWNSRLHTEHERLVKLFDAGEVVADVMAGVGPFAVPAAKKGCLVLGNDLNPEGTKWMEVNRVNNKVSQVPLLSSWGVDKSDRVQVESALRISTTDGRAFIRASPLNVWDNPFPPVVQQKSRKQLDREAKAARKAREVSTPAEGISSLSLQPSISDQVTASTPTAEQPQEPQQIAHFVMNLPDSALTFLDAYRGAYVELEQKLSGAREKIRMPMVHVYCFTREMERPAAERDICQRAASYLGYDLTPDVQGYNLHLVRSVAPNKEMYCLSFRLPEEVAFARD
jgi:tRNA (guanine37-N1)-methyltransferase